VSVGFDGGMLSSDESVLQLRGVKHRLGLADRLAGCLRDRRDAARIEHGIGEYLTELHVLCLRVPQGSRMLRK
jgi:DDE family transposase